MDKDRMKIPDGDENIKPSPMRVDRKLPTMTTENTPSNLKNINEYDISKYGNYGNANATMNSSLPSIP